MTYQDMIARLKEFWAAESCLIREAYDIEKGAGTFHPDTFLRALGPEPWNVAYVEPCRRPTDGRYGENPNRLAYYFQFQVLMKPSPTDIQDRYLRSLQALGLRLEEHDIRFVHDDWESPSLGAWGLGWEVWLDGMEITQFTYFQQVGGISLDIIPAEITYGTERIAMYLQKKTSVFDIQWNQDFTYGDLQHSQEVAFSKYAFEEADIDLLQTLFRHYEAECTRLLTHHNPIAAYDMVLKASHTFNLLDARGAVSVTGREQGILSIRKLAAGVAKAYYEERQALGFPLRKNTPEGQE